MNITESGPPHLASPLSQLERALIDEFLGEKGQDPRALGGLPDDARQRLLAGASVYASGKLMEIEARSHLLHEIHDSGS
jgi:hypothetical protein